MNIGLCSNYSPFSDYGGLEIHVRELGENLVKKGCEVFYIAYKKWKEKNDCFYLRHPKKGPFLFEKDVLYDTTVNPTLLASFIARNDIDILHLEFAHTILTGFLTKLGHKIPIAVQAGSPLYLPKDFLPKEMRLDPLKSKLLEFFYKVVLKHMDAVVCECEYIADVIRTSYSQPCCVIPNSINVKTFSNLPLKKLAKAELGFGEPLILYMGRLSKEKGLKYVFHAMTEILSHVNCKLLIAGQGPMKYHLEHLTKKLRLNRNVKFLGDIRGALKLAYLAAADIFVCPSIFDIQPAANIEALASGLPIVASKVGGIPEIVEDGINGFLVEPRNPHELADAIVRILTDEKLCERVRACNCEKARKYDWSVVIDQYLDLYNQLVG